MRWPETLELILVGLGAFAHLNIVLGRSSSAKTIWFSPILYAWSLCWTVWYASTFSSVNIETIGVGRIPYLTAFTDIAKGAILNMQVAVGLHGISQMTGSLRKVPWWSWYILPAALVLYGGARIILNPMESFLANVEPVVRLYLTMDTAAGCLAVLMLTRGMKRFDDTQKGIARPLRKALAAMIPLLGSALAIKLVWGFEGHGRFQWVLLHDIAHLLPPYALLWATFRTEAVALEVTKASWRRLWWFLALFATYIASKLLSPMSDFDRIATWFNSGIGVLVSTGPLSIVVFHNASQWLNLGSARESELLFRLESRLRRTQIPEDSIPPFLGRCIGRILGAKWKVLPLSDPRVSSILRSRGIEPRPDESPHPIAMRTTTSRAEVQDWAALGARVILPLASGESSKAIVLGSSAVAESLPKEILARLEAILATAQHVLLSRETLKSSLENQRRLEEGERLAMLGLMAASAAHEIKNPLSAIRNVAMAARRDAPEDSVLRRDLDVVVGEVDRLDSSVRRMLHFARDRSVCEDAGETVRVVTGLLEVEARQKGLALDVRTPSGKMPLPISENDLKAILFNLVLNALHHAPRGSRVDVFFDAGAKSISVVNDGEIPVDFRPKLFRPLATRGGNGLGLYISRSKAEESGGRLEYVPGPGTTCFRVSWEDRG